MADCAGLENQCARKGTQGSNPCLSAFVSCRFRSLDELSTRALVPIGFAPPYSPISAGSRLK